MGVFTARLGYSDLPEASCSVLEPSHGFCWPRRGSREKVTWLPGWGSASHRNSCSQESSLSQAEMRAGHWCLSTPGTQFWALSLFLPPALHHACTLTWAWDSLNVGCRKGKCQSLSCVQLFATPWVVARQAPLSLGILQARTLEWFAMPFSRGSSPPRIKPRSPSLQADSLLSEPPGKPCRKGGDV